MSEQASQPAQPTMTVEEWVRRSCERQGVPVKVTDPITLKTVALLLRG